MCHRRRLLVTLSIAGSIGCFASPGRTNPKGPTAFQREILAESLQVAHSADTTWQRWMWDFRRRSLLVPTDSLARLNVALFTHPDSTRGPVRQAVSCELLRLMALAGSPCLGPFLG
jgi:hypothetical protein